MHMRIDKKIKMKTVGVTLFAAGFFMVAYSLLYGSEGMGFWSIYIGVMLIVAGLGFLGMNVGIFAV